MNRMRNGRLRFSKITVCRLAGVIGAVKTGALCPGTNDCIIVHTDICPPKKTRDLPCASVDTCGPTADCISP